jgi:hypothetical protein
MWVLMAPELSLQVLFFAYTRMGLTSCQCSVADKISKAAMGARRAVAKRVRVITTQRTSRAAAI